MNLSITSHIITQDQLSTTTKMEEQIRSMPKSLAQTRKQSFFREIRVPSEKAQEEVQLLSEQSSSREVDKPEFLRVLDNMADKVIVFKDVFYSKVPFFQQTFQ